MGRLSFRRHGSHFEQSSVILGGGFASQQRPCFNLVLETYLGRHALPANKKGLLDRHIYKQVLEAIHATASIDAKQTYQECTDPPYHALSGNGGKGVVDDVVAILEHPSNVRLLFSNGVFDIVCNHVGNERFLQNCGGAERPSGPCRIGTCCGRAIPKLPAS